MYKINDKVWYFSSAKDEYYPAVVLHNVNNIYDIKYFVGNSWHVVHDVDIDDLSTRDHVETAEQEDQVNNPKHYTHGNIEVIDAILDWDLNFCLGNAIKYVARCNHKGNKKQDLQKAIWYIEREIKGIK